MWSEAAGQSDNVLPIRGCSKACSTAVRQAVLQHKRTGELDPWFVPTESHFQLKMTDISSKSSQSPSSSPISPGPMSVHGCVAK